MSHDTAIRARTRSRARPTGPEWREASVRGRSGRIGAWRMALFAGALVAAGCADEPVAPHGAEPEPTRPSFTMLLTCTVAVHGGTMDCEPSSAAPGADGPRLNVIVGSQHQFVRLANDPPVMEDDVWKANVTVQNLSLQPMATADGMNAHADGVRVFFVDEPTNGVVVSNHDGVGTFIDSEERKYYEYGDDLLGPDGILGQGETSGAKEWRFALNGAETFRFSVLIATTVPDPTSYGVHFTRLDLAGDHSCAEASNGEIYCWGFNAYGEVGDGTTSARNTPRRVAPPDGVKFTRVASGFAHTCATGDDGKVYCWGAASLGAIPGWAGNQKTPVAIGLPSSGEPWSDITSGNHRSCAFDVSGTLYCWGYTLTTYSPGGTVVVPLPDSGSVTLSNVAHGANHLCAEGSDKKIYCWGINGAGQLGIGATGSREEPTAVAAPGEVTLSRVAAGSNHNCAFGSDHKLYCWGANNYGQLGDSTKAAKWSPTAVKAPAGVTFTEVALGTEHTCAIATNGRIYCWGRNSVDYQLGDGTGEDKLTPVEVAAPPGLTFSGLEAGSYHTCARGSDGRTYCWGKNLSGQVGDGRGGYATVPTPVAGTTRP